MPDTSDTSDNEEQAGLFDAFRARRAEEQAANEPFPEYYAAQEYDEPGQYEPGQYGQPVPETPAVASGKRRRLRSVAVLAGAAVLVAGVVGGVYAATRSSGAPVAAPGVAASAGPSTGAAKGGKSKAVTAELRVTSVSGDSFAATAADGRTVTVQITASTKFGTSARPFTRSQLVTGAVVYARLRREADGTVAATVIASSTASKDGGASASASGDAGA